MMPDVKRLLLGALQHRRAPVAIIALALLFASPALTTGLVADDHYHVLILRGDHSLKGVPDNPWDLFVWADGTREMAHAFMDVGMTGWWTNPDLLMSYGRPLSVITHRLDHALFGEAAVPMHAHSLLWFGLCLIGLWFLYRRLSPADAPAFVPALCLLLYAFDDAHGLTLSWVANRNAIVALALSVPVLILHDRARRDGQAGGHGRLWATFGSPVLLALALLAGESALGVTAYLFAYALCIDPAGPRKGLLAILPHALVGIVWAVGYRALGFGARGSGLVVDPGSEPTRFLLALSGRLPALLAAQLALPPADLWEFYDTVAPFLPKLMVVVVVAIVLLIGFAMRSVLRAQASARFWALGSVVSAVPVCAQFPHDRLLMFIGVGAMGLMGIFLGRFLDGALRGGFTRFVAGVLCFVHLFMGPLLLPLRVRATADIGKMIGAADGTIDHGPGVEQRTVVLVNPPVDAYAGYIPTLRESERRPRPKHLHWLATAASEVDVERLDDHTLRVRPAAGFLARASEKMQRGPGAPMPVGAVVRLSELSVTVVKATAQGRPLEVHVRFEKPLTDPKLHFQQWLNGGFVDFRIPDPGETVRLPAVDFASLLP